MNLEDGLNRSQTVRIREEDEEASAPGNRIPVQQEESGEASPETPQEVEYQSRDEGVVLFNPDGSERQLVPGTPEEDEVAHQMLGGAPRGPVRYRLRMLDADGTPASPLRGNDQTSTTTEPTPTTPLASPASPEQQNNPLRFNRAYIAAAADGQGDGPSVQSPEPPTPEHSRDGRLDAGRIMSGGPRPGAYEIRDRRYAGIPIKPIRDILADSRDSQLFGEALRAINSKDADGALERYINGAPTKEDMDFMTYAAHEYSLRLRFAEDINKRMTPQEVELLARRNKDFLNLLTHEGDRATEMVHQAILHQAMEKPDDIMKMWGAMADMEKDRGTLRYKRADEDIKAISDRLGLSRKDLTVMVNVSNANERQASKDQLTAYIHERAGTFRRAIDRAERITKIPFVGSSRNAALMAMREMESAMPTRLDVRDPRSWVMNRIDGTLQDIAEFLQPTISNPEMRTRIAREVLSNKNQKASGEGGPHSYEEAQKLSKERFSPKSVEERVRARMRERDWPQNDIAAQDRILGGMAETERKEHAGTGFWAWVFEILLGQNWNKGASAALGRPVHA
ncbi:hypothetical protein C4556_00130 [Candidatus Parcubacteria bacterium]|nr:MAG: hypothetical protein C4556_00130 [Candidatus Parcubacteria bacterium]